jgi:large subunit ribosomal protein L6
MSRIGKKPIQIPQGVEIKIENGLVTVKGPKGELKYQIHPLVTAEVKDGQVLVSVQKEEDKKEKALWGTNQKLIDNMVIGVTTGYEKKLEINGVGYRAQLSGKKLTLNVGFSHPVDFETPEGVTLEVEKNIVTVTGIDKQMVGETAAQIRKIKKPEPYKGKGIKYTEEVIIRKAGKQAKTGA